MEKQHKDALQLLDMQSETPTWDEIRLSYRRCVHRLHPDRADATGEPRQQTEDFIKVTQAYKLLSEYHKQGKAFSNDGHREYIETLDPDLISRQSSQFHQSNKTLDTYTYTYYAPRHHTALKMVVGFSLITAAAAIGVLSFSAWQITQVPPVTPFTETNQLPPRNQ